MFLESEVGNVSPLAQVTPEEHACTPLGGVQVLRGMGRGQLLRVLTQRCFPLLPTCPCSLPPTLLHTWTECVPKPLAATTPCLSPPPQTGDSQ